MITNSKNQNLAMGIHYKGVAGETLVANLRDLCNRFEHDLILGLYIDSNMLQ